MTEYVYVDYDTTQISVEDLKKGDRQFQLDVMRNWFEANYEDPAEHTPYESKEGGYIYIWGGPYDAREELESEFGGIVPDDVIDELVEELESISFEWAGVESADNYDEFYFDVISSNTRFHNTLIANLSDISQLLAADISEHLNNTLNMMLFVNVITALETFLADAFIKTVIGNRKLIRRLVRSNTDFANRKFPISEIFEHFENIEKNVRDYLLDLTWHNLAKVKELYKGTLGIDFPVETADLYRAIAMRHDIVHRNGKTKDGKSLYITRENIEILIERVRQFSQHIDKELAEYGPGLLYRDRTPHH